MRTLGRIAAFVACLVAVGLIGMVTRDGGFVTRWYSGDVDQTISSPDFDVRVLGVELAHEVSEGEEGRGTDGIWVVVEWQADFHRQSSSFNAVNLVLRDGTTFEQRDEYASRWGVPRTDPGFSSTGTSVFQVPPDGLAGAVLTIERSQGFIFTHGAGVRVEGLLDELPEVRDRVTLRAPQTEVSGR